MNFDRLAFRIYNPETGKEYNIYANGRVTGFEHESVCCIVNYIPLLINEALVEGNKNG